MAEQMDSAVFLEPEHSGAGAWFDSILERDLIPDWLIRVGIRRLLAERLREESSPEGQRRRGHFLAGLRESPIALIPDAANRQHYEVPARFFDLVLGPHRKYSCAYWDASTPDLGAAENRMLQRYMERARIEDGQRILDLGCGWGSLSLYLASRYPNSRIVGVSNSHSQRRFILEQAERLGLQNLEIVTADMNRFAPSDFGFEQPFDRIVSVEMFEHMRNYDELLHRIAGWLTPEGSLFVHIFCHREFAYPFEVRGSNDWMAEHFFSGGIMPSRHLLHTFHDDLVVQEQWAVSGTHYQKTSEAWLENMDGDRDEISALFRETYGAGQERRWIVRWRVFFMACAELFGYQNGKEWMVAHYRFAKP